MSKVAKLLQKLNNGSVSCSEARTLMKSLGWFLDRQSGSHEQWIGPNRERLTLATHTKDLKPYQVKELKMKLLK